MLRKWLIRSIALAIVALLFGGIIGLFNLRFNQGDVFPPYSSLRADPLGVSILYESWIRLPAHSARQDFSPELKSDEGSGKALLILGADLPQLRFSNRAESETFRLFLETGGVILLGQEVHRSDSLKEENTGKRDSKNRKSGADKSPGSPHDSPQAEDRQTNPPAKKDGSDIAPAMNNLQGERLVELWNFEVSHRPLAIGNQGQSISVQATNASSTQTLPPLTVHDGWYLTALTNAWHPLFLARGLPVVMERKVGRGRIVIMTESYWLSNEAMQQDRNSVFLAYLLRDVRELIFDESHLGIVSNPGIADLIRKYGLHGLVISLFVLAALFIWRNSVSLIPPLSDDTWDGASKRVMGRDSGAAFANLLRRSVPSSDLVAVCVANWRETKSLSGQSSGTIQQVEAILKTGAAVGSEPESKRRPVEVYRAISICLKRHRK